jgi:hypothetical protein
LGTRCSEGVTQYKSLAEIHFLLKKISSDVWWVSVGYHKEKLNKAKKPARVGIPLFKAACP